MPRVTVVGHPASSAALAGATLLVGGARHLAGASTDCERVVLGPLAPAIARIAAHDGNVVVIASGDPGFFGIVRALREAGIEPLVLPAVSSVALAFARVGLPWDDAVVVSAHGRSLHRAVNVCLAFPKVAVLTAPGGAPDLAAALAGSGRKILAASRLGTPEEKVSDASAAEDPNVVIVLDPSYEPGMGWIAGPALSPRWALPETAYEHRDSMITKAEVRALILARLSPRIGDMVWDIGAGSGSVAIECASFGAAVTAVDRDPAFLAANGFTGRIVQASAPECLPDLPDPDAVFVGGGGLKVLAACAQRRPSRIVAAFAAIDRVVPALHELAAAGYRAEGVQLQASRLSPLPEGSLRLAATNPVFVVSGVLP